ncbi:MAG: Rrf2 family transcriptional regulator [Bdellovibrionales bacterium]|nr:Rrf2 family transcriptional regulator [Bdellovibrionales bacterium]
MAVKLSREEQYGIMALVDLAYNLNGGPAQVRQIAKRQRIPQRFLEQIFAKLRQANVVIGKRGPRGGYSLAKDPSDIRLEEVMRALRPRLQEDNRTDAPALAELIDTVWSEIEGSFHSTLRGVSLANLCQRAKELGISDADTADSLTAAASAASSGLSAAGTSASNL